MSFKELREEIEKDLLKGRTINPIQVLKRCKKIAMEERLKAIVESRERNAKLLEEAYENGKKEERERIKEIIKTFMITGFSRGRNTIRNYMTSQQWEDLLKKLDGGE